VEANRLAQRQQHHGMAEATIYGRAEAQKNNKRERRKKRNYEMMMDRLRVE
jgi:hypothetical protein